MAWNSSVNTFLSDPEQGLGKISAAALVGRKGGVWGISDGFELSPEEQRDVIWLCQTKKPEDTEEKENMTSVHLNREKYIKLRSVDETPSGPIIVFKKGPDGAVFVTTAEVIIVAVFKGPVQAQEALFSVDKYATTIVSYLESLSPQRAA